MTDRVEFLNLFPGEMRPGDMWDEGLTIVSLEQDYRRMEWFIVVDGTWIDGIGPVYRKHFYWPDRAPKRVARRVAS